MDNPFAARTSADFWRRYNRPVRQGRDEDGWLVNYPDPPYDPSLKDEQVEYTQEELERAASALASGSIRSRRPTCWKAAWRPPQWDRRRQLARLRRICLQ